MPPTKKAARALAAARPDSSDTMRVEIRKLDYLVTLVGELVLERNRLLRLSLDLADPQGKDLALIEAVATSTARLSFITDELQNASLRTRMVPIGNIFRKLPRLIRELSHHVGKEIEIFITGQETEIDKTMIEHIHDPLVHILRNSLDHGIESAAQRTAVGKSPVGNIAVDAQQQGDQIIVTIRDDGRGIDPERIRQKVVEKGLHSAEHAAALSRRELLEALFLPGFSTAEKVSNLSGRGVGMDVVRTNLRRLNGSVEIESAIGEGTTITLKVPLTIAILPVLLVQVSDEVYAIPLRSVVETVRMDHTAIHRVDGCEVLVLRDSTVPLLRLSPFLRGFTFEIISTDLNDQSLQRAQEGIYGDYALRNVSPEILRKYFELVPGSREFRVRDEVRKHIRFSRLNLLDDSGMVFVKSLDVIFCCNVLIYFNATSKSGSSSISITISFLTPTCFSATPSPCSAFTMTFGSSTFPVPWRTSKRRLRGDPCQPCRSPIFAAVSRDSTNCPRFPQFNRPAYAHGFHRPLRAASGFPQQASGQRVRTQRTASSRRRLHWQRRTTASRASSQFRRFRTHVLDANQHPSHSFRGYTDALRSRPVRPRSYGRYPHRHGLRRTTRYVGHLPLGRLHPRRR
jgi:two-component sensor histidine kinase